MTEFDQDRGQVEFAELMGGDCTHPHLLRSKRILPPANNAARLRWIEETRKTDFKAYMFTDKTAIQVRIERAGGVYTDC